MRAIRLVPESDSGWGRLLNSTPGAPVRLLRVEEDRGAGYERAG